MTPAQFIAISSSESDKIELDPRNPAEAEKRIADQYSKAMEKWNSPDAVYARALYRLSRDF